MTHGSLRPLKTGNLENRKEASIVDDMNGKSSPAGNTCKTIQMYKINTVKSKLSINLQHSIYGHDNTTLALFQKHENVLKLNITTAS